MTQLAHVKWFADFNWATPPESIAEITTTTFWAMLAVSVVTLLVLVVLDQKVDAAPWARRLSAWFEARSDHSLLVMRVAAFATLLVAWQQGTLFAPELVVNNLWIERLQFTIIVFLCSERTTPLAGLGIAALWGMGVDRFGFFHLLDYVNVLGVAYFLAARPLASPLVRATALPALYVTVGFSLMWLGCEKLVYPEWVGYLLEQNPVLTLGLDKDFFRVASAFIELGLGYMLVIGLFGRSLSITVTLTFFLTTMIFGKLEIIGHTLIHAALIVFLFEGPGRAFRPPAYFHRTVPMRMAFAAVNFVILVFAALGAYTWAAERAADKATAGGGHAHHALVEAPAGTAAPTLAMEIAPDPAGGWNVRLRTTNFRFAPERAGAAHAAGEGHVHLHVDGDKAARAYGEWLHLPALPPGKHTIEAVLSTNDHRSYARDGKPISARATVEAE
jgi:hypothetical protein